MTTKTNKSSNRCFIICGGQGLAVSYYLIICRGPGLVVCYCLIISPWSRVGGQLLFYDIGDLPPKPFREQSFQNKRFVRGFLEMSQTKLPKRAFHARLPRNFSDRASNTKVSRETSSQFHRTSFQNERFARGFFEISQNKLAKRAFRTMLPRQFSQKKLPKRSFRAMLPRNFHRTSCQNAAFRARLLQNFTEQASKTNVLCEASSNFHRTKLPKRTFRARLPQIFKEQAFKTNVSCEAFLKFSQNKLPKRTFRTRLPPNFTEQAYKASVSRETSSNFERTKLPKRTFRAKLPTISIENLRFATVSCHQPTESYERVHPEKAKCAYRYNGAPFKISKCTLSLQRRAPKCINPAHDVREDPRRRKISILPHAVSDI